MSTEQDVRQIATALPQVVEKTSYGTAAYYVAGKIFARMHDRPERLVCWRASLEDRQDLLDSAPEKFFTTDHYRGHPSVLVRLDRVATDELAELLTEAWESRAPKRLIVERFSPPT